MSFASSFGGAGAQSEKRVGAPGPLGLYLCMGLFARSFKPTNHILYHQSYEEIQIFFNQLSTLSKLAYLDVPFKTKLRPK
jgi:hypothetical protein